MSALQLCFWGYAEGDPSIKIKMHAHDYYQFNFTLSGACDLVTETKRYLIRKNDLVLVAPNVPHTLEYHGKYLSQCYKFYQEGFSDLRPVLHVTGSAFTEGVIHASETIMKATFPIRCFGVLEGTVILPGDHYQVLMEHFLSGVISHLLQQSPSYTGILARIYDTLEHTPAHLFSVKEAAEACRYTRSHFSALVHQQTGQTAKDFLNDIKLKMAKRFLRYSDKSIGEIAESIGFSSQFHFSFFFKRLAGVTPLKYRKDLRGG